MEVESTAAATSRALPPGVSGCRCRPSQRPTSLPPPIVARAHQDVDQRRSAGAQHGVRGLLASHDLAAQRQAIRDRFRRCRSRCRSRRRSRKQQREIGDSKSRLSHPLHLLFTQSVAGSISTPGPVGTVVAVFAPYNALPEPEQQRRESVWRIAVLVVNHVAVESDAVFT